MTIDVENVKRAIEEGYILQCPFCGSVRICAITYGSGSIGDERTEHTCQDCKAKVVAYAITEGWEEAKK